MSLPADPPEQLGPSDDSLRVNPELLGHLDEAVPPAQVVAAFFSGPVPLPRILRGYDELVPGSAKQIIGNSLEQSKHRRNVEKMRIQGDEQRANHGLYIGGALAAGCIISGTVLGLHGDTALATLLFTTTIASITGSFVYSHHQRQKEIEGKAKLRESLAKSSDSPSESSVSESLETKPHPIY